MKQAINLRLKIKSKTYNISKKFKPHITLVYPFENIPQQELEQHIKKSIKNIKTFEIKLKGLKKSVKGYHLYLLVDRGKNKIMRLYKKLNSGILKEFKNLDMPTYIPHTTLEIFKTKKQIDKVIKDLRPKNQEYTVKINSIQLLTLNKDDSIKSIKNFMLK